MKIVNYKLLTVNYKLKKSMEIVLKRIAKKNTYTIGRLYILADEDVDRKVITSYNEGLKRVFRDSFD